MVLRKGKRRRGGRGAWGGRVLQVVVVNGRERRFKGREFDNRMLSGLCWVYTSVRAYVRFRRDPARSCV